MPYATFCKHVSYDWRARAPNIHCKLCIICHFVHISYSYDILPLSLQENHPTKWRLQLSIYSLQLYLSHAARNGIHHIIMTKHQISRVCVGITTCILCTQTHTSSRNMSVMWYMCSSLSLLQVRVREDDKWLCYLFQV